MDYLTSKCRRPKAFLRRNFSLGHISQYLRHHYPSTNPSRSNEKEVVPKDFTVACFGVPRKLSNDGVLDGDANSELGNTVVQNQLTSPMASSKLSWSDIDCNDTCSVCFEALRPDCRSTKITRTKPIVRMSVCGHIFHSACIKAWMVSGGPSCPNCRSSQRKLMMRMRLATG